MAELQAGRVQGRFHVLQNLTRLLIPRPRGIARHQSAQAAIAREIVLKQAAHNSAFQLQRLHGYTRDGPKLSSAYSLRRRTILLNPRHRPTDASEGFGQHLPVAVT